MAGHTLRVGMILSQELTVCLHEGQPSIRLLCQALALAHREAILEVLEEVFVPAQIDCCLA